MDITEGKINHPIYYGRQSNVWKYTMQHLNIRGGNKKNLEISRETIKKIGTNKGDNSSVGG